VVTDRRAKGRNARADSEIGDDAGKLLGSVLREVIVPAIVCPSGLALESPRLKQAKWIASTWFPRHT
jgi:hypothetical protein